MTCEGRRVVSRMRLPSLEKLEKGVWLNNGGSGPPFTTYTGKEWQVTNCINGYGTRRGRIW